MSDISRGKPVPRYEGLQVLRVVAAVMVIVLHTTLYVRERMYPGQALWAPGYGGVDIFFVLSGFVMIVSSDRLYARVDGWKIFAQRRLVRIVPMYWIITTLKIGLTLVAGRYVLHSGLSAARIICSYLFLPSYNIDGNLEPIHGVGWTLNFEMFFYFLFAFALATRLNVFKFIGVVLSVLAVGAYFRKPDWPAASFYLHTIVLEFFLGMLIAKWYQRHGSPRPLAAATAMLAGFIGLLLWPLIPFPCPQVLVIGIPAALVVFGAASLQVPHTSVGKLLLFLGDSSYMIYLVHPLISPSGPALLKLLHSNSPAAAVIAGVVLGCIGGSLVYIVADRPIARWFRERLWTGGERTIRVA